MQHRRKAMKFICEENNPVVSTKAGKLRGYIADDVYMFKGIQYATAGRFLMPEPVSPWDGIKDALAYGPGCPEMTFSMKTRTELDQLAVPGRIWSISEDCQNLNIWTKSISSSAKRPVMVWLHGGGFSGGSATHLFSYDGYEMADNYDVVLVTVNHRLNMSGFFDLSEFGERYAHSGNVGMADIVAALEWVRDNIADFGGDPDNVTIYGQSGGGGKVTTLLQMPSADGLYHRAIIQSGVMRGGPSSRNIGEVAAKAVELLKLDKGNISEIETMDYETVSAAITEAAKELGIHPFGLWAPVADGKYYVGSAFDVGFRQETKDVPLIVGSCVTEFASMPPGNKAEWTDEQRMAGLKEAYDDKAEEVKAQFLKAYPELDWSYAAIADTRSRPAVLQFLDLRTKQAAAPVYNYIFAFESPLMGGQLMGHNSDLHFMFHNALYMEAMCKPGVTERIQDEMAGAWARFAYSGNPNFNGLITWEAYTPENGACLQLGDTTVLKHKHDAGLLEILSQFPSKSPFPSRD